MNRQEIMKDIYLKGKENSHLNNNFFTKTSSFNTISGYMYDNISDKSQIQWFGLNFKDVCLFKYDITTKLDFYSATTEENLVMNRYFSLIEVIENNDKDKESIRINVETTLPITSIKNKIDLNKRTKIDSEFIFINESSLILNIKPDKYYWDHMFNPETESLSCDITKDNPMYQALKDFLKEFKEDSNKEFGIFVNANIILSKE